MSAVAEPHDITLGKLLAMRSYTGTSPIRMIRSRYKSYLTRPLGEAIVATDAVGEWARVRERDLREESFRKANPVAAFGLSLRETAAAFGRIVEVFDDE